MYPPQLAAAEAEATPRAAEATPRAAAEVVVVVEVEECLRAMMTMMTMMTMTMQVGMTPAPDYSRIPRVSGILEQMKKSRLWRLGVYWLLCWYWCS